MCYYYLVFRRENTMAKAKCSCSICGSEWHTDDCCPFDPMGNKEDSEPNDDELPEIAEVTNIHQAVGG